LFCINFRYLARTVSLGPPPAPPAPPAPPMAEAAGHAVPVTAHVAAAPPPPPPAPLAPDAAADAAQPTPLSIIHLNACHADAAR
jgi:hypothetical protein